MPKTTKSSEFELATRYFGRPFGSLLARRVFIPLQMHPNTISAVSIWFGLGGIAFNFFGLFFFGALSLFVWLALDCADGDVARSTEKFTELGEGLERLNSNILYALFLPSVAFGYIFDGGLSSQVLVPTVVVSSFYAANRGLLSKQPNNLLAKNPSSFNLIVVSQFKNAAGARRQSRIGKNIFVSWRNLLTQGGVFELAYLLAAGVYQLQIYDGIYVFILVWTAFYSVFLAFVLLLIALVTLKPSLMN